MATFKLPLSGDVTQSFAHFFNPLGSQFGLVNIILGQSSDPKVEQEVLDDVGTYGKQLGRIGDVLIVLMEHFANEHTLTDEEKKTFAALNEMLEKIAGIKKKHGRDAQHPGEVALTSPTRSATAPSPRNPRRGKEDRSPPG
jgi:hypothetical protein